MITFSKHHKEHLDGTKGSWRPALIASVFGVDGHPIAWKEIVVISCPTCACQFGVGGDDVQINSDGTSSGPVTCHHCGWTDSITAEKFDHALGRSHFNQLKATAETEVSEARIRTVKEEMRKDLLADLDARAMSEAKKILPDGDPNHQELFKNFMKNRT
jgi:hypothetical protein